MAYLFVAIGALVLFAVMPKVSAGIVLALVGGFVGFWVAFIADGLFLVSGPHHEHGPLVIIGFTLACATALPALGWYVNRGNH